MKWDLLIKENKKEVENEQEREKEEDIISNLNHHRYLTDNSTDYIVTTDLYNRTV